MEVLARYNDGQRHEIVRANNGKIFLDLNIEEGANGSRHACTAGEYASIEEARAYMRKFRPQAKEE